MRLKPLSMWLVTLRLLSAIPALAGVVVVTFMLTRVLPGDPAVHLASNPSLTASDIEALRQSMGLDKPLWRQFGGYVSDLLHGDLGQSLSTGRAVTTELATRLPASLELTVTAFLLAVTVAIPLGVAASRNPGSVTDWLARVVAMLGLALPSFVAGLLLIYAFYFKLGLAPQPTGRLDPMMFPPERVTGFYLIDTALAGDFAAFRSALAQLALPACTMALFALAPLIRITRGAMVNVLGADFIRTARANGLRPQQIIWTYAFRNALPPIITSLAMVFSYMLGANVLVEKLFAWPGIGAFAIDSVINLDYAPLQGVMLVMAAIFILVNLIADLVGSAIDPRAR